MGEVIVRRVRDESGVWVTYLPVAEVCRAVDVCPNTVSRWALMGAVRCLPKLRGRTAVSVLDTAVLRLTPVSESLAQGIRRMPVDSLAKSKVIKDATQLATQPALAGGEIWDDYDIVRLLDLFEAGHTCRDIAMRLERTYLAVLARVSLLRQEGDLPPTRDLTWLSKVQPLLTGGEREALSAVV